MSDDKKDDDEKILTWRLKTLLEDIESTGYDFENINLTVLSILKPGTYGARGIYSEKSKRDKLSNRLSDLKKVHKRGIANWEQYIRSKGVFPGASTIRRLKEETEKKKAKAEKGTSSGKGKKQESQSTEQKAADSSDDDEYLPEASSPEPPLSISFATKRKATNPPPTMSTRSKTPPRPPSSLSLTPSRLPTPLRTSTKMESGATSIADITGLVSGVSLEASQYCPGSYDSPSVVRFNGKFQGSYDNGYQIFFQPDMVKSTETSFQGYLIYKKCDPGDLMKNTASIPPMEYLLSLLSMDVIREQDLEGDCILFKKPRIESGDKVGNGGIADVMWPTEEDLKLVKSEHSTIDTEIKDFYFYTLVFFEGVKFDNRIMSEHDSELHRHLSMPATVKDKSVDEEVVIWHAIWRVAIKGTGKQTDTAAVQTVADMKKKMRALYGAPVANTPAPAPQNP